MGSSDTKWAYTKLAFNLFILGGAILFIIGTWTVLGEQNKRSADLAEARCPDGTVVLQVSVPEGRTVICATIPNFSTRGKGDKQ